MIIGSGFAVEYNLSALVFNKLNQFYYGGIHKIRQFACERGFFDSKSHVWDIFRVIQSLPKVKIACE